MPRSKQQIAAVLPCYKSKDQVLDVLARMPDMVSHIYCIDDACPEGTGKKVEEECTDTRVQVLYHPTNKGVGGAVKTGFIQAQTDGADIIVKIDSDGQMDPSLLGKFIDPIIQGRADYTKGNRFFNPRSLRAMPNIRLFGNAVLSFMNKFSSGYWHLFDPNNGYVAIHAKILALLPLDSIADRYFFETDMLFRLNTVRAVVLDIPMPAQYGDETSNLHIHQVLGSFFKGHIKNFVKRIFYNYFLRDFHAASLQLILALILLPFGTIYGGIHWLEAVQTGELTPTGIIMAAVLPIIIGIQMLLSVLQFDIENTPSDVLHPHL